MASSEDIDISDLTLLRRFTIEWSRTKRLSHRALMLANEREPLPEMHIQATSINPWLNSPNQQWGHDPDYFLDCHIAHARRTLGYLFANINEAINSRSSQVYEWNHILSQETPSWQELDDVAQKFEEEATTFVTRMEEGPSASQEQGLLSPITNQEYQEQDLPTPIPGQGYQEGLPFSTTKFLVFCTATIPKSVLNAFLTDARAGCDEFADQTAGLALLTDASLDAPYCATAPVPDNFTAPAAFRDRTPDGIHHTFLRMVFPLDGAPCFFGQHAFVILDAQTAADAGRTCLLASGHLDGDGVPVREVRRAETPVALAHLVCAELLAISLAQAAYYLRDRDDALTFQRFTVENAIEEGTPRRKMERLIGGM